MLGLFIGFLIEHLIRRRFKLPDGLSEGTPQLRQFIGSKNN